MQIPILSGIYTDGDAEYRSSYPRNMVPIPKQQGISNGYLRPGEGLLHFSNTDGIDRGGINWNEECYRVIGGSLCHVAIDGAVTIIGDVGDDAKPVTMAYSFDYLAVSSANGLYLYDGETLAKVDDADLGEVKDVLWIDGYFVTTDGEFIVVTELSDPFSVNPLKYGSSEINPDAVVALKTIRNEVVAVNRYTVEFFDNVGGAANQFPFSRIDGAQLDRGCVGNKACDVFAEALAFVGGSLKEAPAVWIGRSGTTQKISTREVDLALSEISQGELSEVVIEARRVRNHEFLYIHLPKQTWVYDLSASKEIGFPVWFTLDSGILEPETYRARYFVYCYGKWIFGDPIAFRLGETDTKTSHHFGIVIAWSFGTVIIFNETNGAIFHEMTLTALPGRVALGKQPYINTQYSVDGLTWSVPKRKSVGTVGGRLRDITWYGQGRMNATRLQRFSGTSDAFISFARLDVRLEGLAH